MRVDAARFAPVAARLRAAVNAHVTPAAVLEVGSATGPMFQFATGALTHAVDALPCTLETVFDLASLTKVLATASLAMRAVEQDAHWLETRVADLLPEWRGADRAPVTIRHLLEHASGLPAHAKLFEVARDRREFLARIVECPLAVEPGTASAYSDLGFILLGFLLESELGAPLDRLFESIASRLDGPIGFNPAASVASVIAPTESDPWRGRVLQGEVHDENAAALGGVAGHAGLFGTARAVGSFGQTVLRTFAQDTWLSRRETIAMFATRSTVPGSSRALGWDTMLPTSSCGTRMSPRAIGHTGFTGTSLWIDPENDVYVALLTNRVHPTRAGDGIQALRREMHDAVMAALGD